MKYLKAFIIFCAWGTVHAQEPTALSQAGGTLALNTIKSEGLSGAVRVSAQCMEDVRGGRQSPYYCLGLESVSMMLFRRTSPSTLNATTLGWFDDEAMTHRVFTYCYTHLGLKGDMQCLAQMSMAKAAVTPLLLD